MLREQYKVLSELFMYPKEGYKENVRDCMSYLEINYPDAASSFKRFSDFIESKTLFEIEEIFGITFHIQAICYLDIGYVLFGEDYSRGEFLLNMKKEQEKIKHDCGEELADNLPHVLQLMAISEDEEFVQELTARAVVPAVEKMQAEFKESRLVLKQKAIKKKQKAVIMEGVIDGNIYQNAILALLKVLKKDVEGISYNEPEQAMAAANVKGFEDAACGTCSFINNNTTKTAGT